MINIVKKKYKLKIIISNMTRCIHQVHFIGIGGAGMSGIAKILVSAGYQVSGSDLISNEVTNQLIKLGVTVFFEHNSNNIYGADLLVISSAIKLDNPEVIAAKNANILIVHRSVILAALMRSKCVIAVAGTHGKSTTTGMIVSIYCESGLDPSFINGGTIKSLDMSAHLGGGPYLIVEADESDRSFLRLHPTFEVITNISTDHMDTYQGSVKNLMKAFLNFLHNLPVYGQAVVCLDDMVIRVLLPYINRKIVTYGFSEDADLRIVDYCQSTNKINFVLCRKNMSDLYITTNVPGRHNALNAAAAIAVAMVGGVNDESILQAMLRFHGVSRRFEILGLYNLQCFNGVAGEVILVDDYGHHPVELDAIISTVRIGWPDYRLVMVFQPHRFTRIRDLYNDFVKILSKVDILLILDVCSAGERFISGTDSFSLCESIRRYGKINPILVSERILSNVLAAVLKGNDLLLMQGAGTIGNIAQKLANNKLIV